MIEFDSQQINLIPDLKKTYWVLLESFPKPKTDQNS